MALHFTNDRLTFHLIHCNEVNFVATISLPIVGDDIVQSRLTVFLPEISFKEITRESIIIAEYLP